VADTGNDTIRVIAPDPASNNAITPNSVVSTLAGSPGQPGYADGQGANALFNAPIGLAVSSSGTIYIGDSQNHVIRQMTPSGTVSLYAGTPGKPGFQNGAAGSALFNQPNGLALKADGTLLVADYGNSSIRSISPAGQVATLAGQDTHGFADGAPSSALFYWPVSIAVDATGVVWVADTSNHVIRKISADGSVLTIAGAGGTAGNLDGTGTAALFDFPCGIAVLPSGDLLVADTDNHYLRKVTTSGVVTTYLAP
jgi:sugar lactone lactonase YvrE